MIGMTREEIKRQNETHKKVWFIGAGYEAVKTVIVEATTNGEAIDKALDLYKSEGWGFGYNELEVAKCI